jgi:hypothetical protein
MSEHVSFRIDESAETPLLGLVFGWAAMLPFVPGAVAVWLWRDSGAAVGLTIVWGGAVLAFLAGVRRGLSFRMPGGEDAGQIVTMLGPFLLAFAALVSPWPVASLIFLLIGYAGIALLDPIAARRRRAPLFFASFRPLQMLVPVACLGAIIVRIAVL